MTNADPTPDDDRPSSLRRIPRRGDDLDVPPTDGESILELLDRLDARLGQAGGQLEQARIRLEAEGIFVIEDSAENPPTEIFRSSSALIPTVRTPSRDLSVREDQASRLTRLEGELVRLRHERGSVTAEHHAALTSARDRLAETQAQVHRLEQQLVQRRDDPQSARQVSILASERDRLAELIHDLTRRIERAEAEAAAARARPPASPGPDGLVRIEGQIDELVAEREAQRREVARLQAELAAVKRRAERAMETAQVATDAERRPLAEAAAGSSSRDERRRSRTDRERSDTRRERTGRERSDARPKGDRESTDTRRVRHDTRAQQRLERRLARTRAKLKVIQVERDVLRQVARPATASVPRSITAPPPATLTGRIPRPPVAASDEAAPTDEPSSRLLAVETVRPPTRRILDASRSSDVISNGFTSAFGRPAIPPAPAAAPATRGITASRRTTVREPAPAPRLPAVSRRTVAGLLLVAALGFLLLLGLLALRPASAQTTLGADLKRITAPGPGLVHFAVAAGDQVQAGDPVAEVVNDRVDRSQLDALDARRQALQSRQATLVSELATLRQVAPVDPLRQAERQARLDDLERESADAKVSIAALVDAVAVEERRLATLTSHRVDATGPLQIRRLLTTSGARVTAGGDLLEAVDPSTMSVTAELAPGTAAAMGDTVLVAVLPGGPSGRGQVTQVVDTPTACRVQVSLPEELRQASLVGAHLRVSLLGRNAGFMTRLGARLWAVIDP